jgi:hypothetical protein
MFERDNPLVISCDDCAMQHTDHCQDCVVSFLCGGEPGQPVTVEEPEARVLDLLIDAGLVPALRQVPRTTGTREAGARMLRSR